MDVSTAALLHFPAGAGLGDGVPRVVSVQDPDFAARGDLRTDDTRAIQKAANAAAALVEGSVLANTHRPVLYFPSARGYFTSATIAIAADVDVVMEAPIIARGAAGTGMTGIALGSMERMTRGGRFVLDIRREGQSNWRDGRDIGLVLWNICSSEIRIKRVQGWRTGVQFVSRGLYAGCYYNNVFIGEIRGAKFSLDLHGSGIGGGDGAINANNFYGGSFSNGASESVTGQSRYGVRFSGKAACNTNQFYGPSFELDAKLAAPGEAVPFLIENGSALNRAYNVRSEGDSDPLVRITSEDAKSNFFWSAYTSRGSANAAQVDDTSRYRTNRVFTHFDELRANSHLIFDSGNLGAQTRVYDGTSAYSVAGFDIATSDFGLHIAQTLIGTRNERHLVFRSSGRGLVRFVDTRVNKRFVVMMDFGARVVPWSWAIKTFDAGGRLLAGTGHVHGEDANAMWYNDSFAGAYVASGATDRAYFVVDDQVSSIAFIIIGSPELEISSMKLYGIDAPCSTWQEARAEVLRFTMIASGMPNAGSWTRGDRILNHTPSPGDVEGWICTRSGTFGTLDGGRVSTVAQSDKVSVADASRVEPGMYVMITGLSGPHRVRGRQGNVLTLSARTDRTLNDAVLAYAPPQLKSFGSIAG